MPHSGVLSEYPEVVAVQVNWVVDSKTGIVFDDEDDELGGSDTGGPAHSDDVVVQREVGLAIHHASKSRVLPVNLQAAAVECPLEPIAAGGKAQAFGGNLVDNSDIQRQVRDKVRYSLVSAALSLGDGADSGWIGSARAVIAHNASDTVCILVVAASRIPLCAQPVVARSGISLNDDVVALAHADAHGFCGVGDNWDEIVANNGQIVAVNRELEVAVGSGVDDPDAILLASLKGSLPFGSVAQALCVGRSRTVECVCAVDETVLHGRWPSVLHNIPQGKCLGVTPVVEEHHAKVLIVVSRGRTIQDQASKSTLCVLQGEMAVIPGRAVLSDLEVISLGGTRRNGAFGDTRHTVVVTAVELPQTVPVNSSAVSQEVIGDVNLEVITPVGLK